MDYYLFFIIIPLLIGLAASADVKSQLKKYSKVQISNRLTGAQAALNMLHNYGIYNVAVRMGTEGQDFFDPRSNSITLSPSVFHGTSITATATACHEVGHACQYAEKYAPMQIRGMIVPVASLASNMWIFVFFAGIFFQSVNLSNIAILMFAAVVIFEVVTLPVEFNASKRAKIYMQSIGLTSTDIQGSSRVLRACACTYVAAALTSILQLLWLLGQNRD